MSPVVKNIVSMEELVLATHGQDSSSFWYLVRRFDANGWQMSAFVRNAKEQKIATGKDGIQRISVPKAVADSLQWAY